MTTATELNFATVIAEQERIAWASGDTAKAALLGALTDVTEDKDDAERQSGEVVDKLDALLGAVDALLSGVSTMQDDLAGIIDLKTKDERNREWNEWDKRLENLLDGLRSAYAKADA